MKGKFLDSKILKLSVIAVICVVMLIINIFAGRLQYAVNDDYALNFMAAGAYGTYGEYMIGISIAYGLLLKLLYTILPTLNWYLFLLLGLNLLSICVLCICVCRKLDIYKAALVSFIINLALAENYYAKVTFTTTASILAIAGLCEIALCLYEYSRLRLFMGILLTIFSGFIRIKCYIMALPVAIISMAYFIYKNKKLSRRMLIYIFIIFVPILFWQINVLAYQLNPYAKDVMELNYIGGDIIDHVDFTPEEMEIANQNGFSSSEISLIRNFLIGDTERYNYDRIKKLRDDLYDSRNYSFRMSRSVLSTVCFHIYNKVLNNIEILAILWMFLLLYAIISCDSGGLVLWGGYEHIFGSYVLFFCLLEQSRMESGVRNMASGSQFFLVCDGFESL